MAKRELIADIEAHKHANSEARKKARAEIKLHDHYRTLIKLHGQGKGIEEIAKLTGLPMMAVFEQLLEAAQWWKEASKHIDANLAALLNPPTENN